jgi:hypothetical protein
MNTQKQNAILDGYIDVISAVLHTEINKQLPQSLEWHMARGLTMKIAQALVDGVSDNRADERNSGVDEFTLLGVLADIRQKTGVGDKVMLLELADTLAALIQNGDSAIDTNKRLVEKLSTTQPQDEVKKCNSCGLPTKDGLCQYYTTHNPQPQANREVVEALELAVGDILYMADERGELNRFQGTVDKLCADISALQPETAKDNCEHEWVTNIHFGHKYPEDATDFRFGCCKYKCKKCAKYSNTKKPGSPTQPRMD